MPTRTFATRTAILDQLVNQRLLDAEAKATGTSAGKLIAAEKVKVTNPTETEIKAVYDANRQALGEQTLDQARKQIVAYLRREPEQKLLAALITKLKAKYKYVAGKGVNSTNLAPSDIVATVNQQQITGKDYDDLARLALYELGAAVSDLVLDDLDEALYNSLIAEEAKSLNLDPGALIAREITNKMKEFSDEERRGLENTLSKRLFTKYKAAILYKGPEPVVQTISADDDPSIGPADAPVTIVMFSDFQCSACGDTSYSKKSDRGVCRQNSLRRSRFSARKHSRKRVRGGPCRIGGERSG